MTKEEFNIQDERLLGQFFEKERSKVLVVLRNRLSISTEDAEDIYQDACIALFNNIQKGKLKTLTCSLSTYFTQICLNMGYNFVNRGHSTRSARADAVRRGGTGGAGQHGGTRRAFELSHARAPCRAGAATSGAAAVGTDRMKEIADVIGFNGADSVKSKKSQCMSRLKERFTRIIKSFYE